MALLGVLLLPLFVGTWRTSLLGLGCQGLLMALIAHRLGGPAVTPSDWIELAELALVRGLGAPLALYAVLQARGAPSRNDVIPPNLLSWACALATVLLSFTFAEGLVPAPGEQRTLVAVACAGVLLGFLVLSTQTGPFSQMIGALRIENAIALAELGGERHEQPLGVRLGLATVFVATVFLFRGYLRSFTDSAAAGPETTPRPEGPTL
jgi:hydrogenase-4 membrane subunit HyfE